MPEHGHANCPHCDTELEGGEATCPSCSGPLFGIAPKNPSDEAIEEQTEDYSDGALQVDSAIIDGVVVPVYTPPDSKDSDDDEGEAATQTAPDQPSSEGLDATELIQRGEALGLAGDYKPALDLFNQAIALDPSDHMAWFNRGVLNESMGDVPEAIKAFRIALDNNGEHGPSAANMSVLLDQLGRSDEAVPYAQTALLSFPGHPALVEMVERAGAAIPVYQIHESEEETADDGDSGDSEQLADGEDAETNWPEPSGFVRTLEASQATEKVAYSARSVSEVVGESPADSGLDALAEQAAQLIREGDAASALDLLRPELPGAAANHPRCWRIAAGAMARLDLNDSAKEAFSYALELDNSDAAAWFNLGALHRKDGDLEGAFTCFSTASELKGDYAKALNGLALVAVETGRIEAAIDAFRSLLIIDPSHASGIEFASLLIDLAEGEGKVLELVKSIPATLPAGPEMAGEALTHISADSHILRARALTLVGNHVDSVTLYRSLLEADKNNPDLWSGLAKALDAAGDAETAKKCRDKAATLLGEPTPDSVAIAGANAAFDTPVAEQEQVSAEQEIEGPEEDGEDEEAWADDVWDTTDETEDEPSADEDDSDAISTEEIVAHESVLDAVDDSGTEISIHTSDPVVKDAAASLHSQQSAMDEHQVLGDSSSVANQDIEWYNKGLELLSKEKYREALSCFDRALPTFKDDKAMAIKTLNGRGNCFYYLDEFKKAIECYYKAFSIDRALTTGAALYNMGTSYAELESYDNAIHCFEQSIGADVGEPLDGDNKNRTNEQIRRCRHLLKEQKRRVARA
jgi:tetratricopeptide (TPR) repeat protein